MIKQVIISVVFLMLFLGFSKETNAHSKLKNPTQNNFVLVELFTSEGCSSCPPAESIFNEMVQQNRDNIFAISYHVDYWDRLGWKDPFSRKDCTERQYNYNLYFKNQSIYTPQVIVNGQSEFVGSDKSSFDKSIQKRIENEIKIQLKPIMNNSILVVDYTIEGKIEDKILTTVLTQREAETEVKRGENAGRKLLHNNIARTINNANLKQNSGKFTMNLPIGFNKKDYFLIAFIQSSKNGKVDGIVKIDL
jgi:hypothetical protein